MSIHEECGVFGAFAPRKTNIASLVYYGLFALQHRGQESCGIVVNDSGVFESHKDLGLVSEVFSRDVLKHYPMGNIAVGHVRYATTGCSNRANCQPLEVNHQKGHLALAHNGNLSNALELRDALELSGAIFHTTSDTETIAYLITRERLRCGSIEEAVMRTMPCLEGAYSLVLMSPRKMILARDPRGFRPLCFGRTPEGTYVAASESCAIQAAGAEFMRDLEPGEVLVFTDNTEKETGCFSDGKIRTEISAPDDAISVVSYKDIVKKERSFCVFEYIYFARPDSVIDGVSVHAARCHAGRTLAKEHPVEADVVIGVPDSGLDAALGYALESGIPYEIGLIKNKYIGRTFIAPGQELRLDQVRIKLNPVKPVLEGKRVVLIDDSIVRGTTSKRLVQLLRDAGAAEIHMRVSAPPFLHPCYYGTDIDSEENLIAAHHSVAEIAELIGVDSLGYLSVGALAELSGTNRICTACFDGKYPTDIPTDVRKDRFESKLPG
ncbi:MAG: amidophosphoribosyltransferase [Blautia sp.]|nr:amidophosphoribosyltransferase [Blautia sp.]